MYNTRMLQAELKRRVTYGGSFPPPERRPDPNPYELENYEAMVELDCIGDFLKYFSRTPVMSLASEFKGMGQDNMISVIFGDKSRKGSQETCRVEYDQFWRKITKVELFSAEDIYKKDKKSRIEIQVLPGLRKPNIAVTFNQFARDFAEFHSSEESAKVQQVKIGHRHTAVKLLPITTTVGQPTLELTCISRPEVGLFRGGPVGRVVKVVHDSTFYSPQQGDVVYDHDSIDIEYDSQPNVFTFPDGQSYISTRDVEGVLHMTSRIFETPAFEINRDLHTAELQYRFNAKNLEYLRLLFHARWRLEKTLYSQMTD